LNTIRIRTDAGEHPISRHIYGHFAEHLGRCIYDGIWVGEDSAIANIRGIRTDIVEALRQIRIPNLRWPGGCFADDYHWKNGIGPRSNRPKTVNRNWGQLTESNDFGTHEFLDLCEQLGCEPYICGNVGSGTVREMAEWVEYITYPGASSLADLRRDNGREQPWPLTYWGVGNESWVCGGNMRPEYYADVYRRYQTFLPNFGDNKLYRIACGPYESNFEWTEVLMRKAAEHMDGLSLHYYVLPGTWEKNGSDIKFDEDEWFITLKKAMKMEELLQKHSEIMDKYDPDKRIGLIVDEWGTWYDPKPESEAGQLYQQNTIRDALVAGLTLNIYNRRCDRVFMANIAQTVNVLQAMILTKAEQMILTPTYHVFRMYTPHHDANALPVEITTEQYSYEDDSIPALSVSASRLKDGKVAVSTCNFNPESSVKVKCELQGMKASRVSGELLTAAAMNAHNTFAQPDNVVPVAFDAVKIEDNCPTFEQPPKSVLVLEIQ
jgi:alpha-N-arabinofuranosidase